MLQVDLRELARGPVEMRADLAGTDPLFEGLEVTLAEPVQVAGRLQDAGDGRFYWRASLRQPTGGEGPGCLAPPAGATPAAARARFSHVPPTAAATSSDSPPPAAPADQLSLPSRRHVT